MAEDKKEFVRRFRAFHDAGEAGDWDKAIAPVYSMALVFCRELSWLEATSLGAINKSLLLIEPLSPWIASRFLPFTSKCLYEVMSKDWKMLAALSGLVVRAVEFQSGEMTGAFA